MASYLELLSAAFDDGLRQKMRIAVVIAAEAIRTEDAGTPNHTARMAWARAACNNPEGAANGMIYAVLAQNKDAALADILAADDATIQTAVNSAVNLMAA